MKTLLYLFLVLVANTAFAEVIRSLKIEGNQRIEQETVSMNFGYKSGDDVNDQKIAEGIKKLYSTGLFKNVDIIRLQGDIKIVVEENPMIHTLQIEGNRRIKSDDILPELLLSSRSIMTKSKVIADVATIQRLYQRSGRYDVKVVPKTVELPNNRVNLIYEVTEGPKTLVGSFVFIGNSEFGNYKLLDVLTTKEDSWYRFLSDSPKMDVDKLNFDRELLIRFYSSRGYADINISQPIIEYDLEHKSFTVTFMINEGRKYKYGNIDIINNISAISNDEIKEIKKSIEAKSGNIYDGEELQKDVEKVIENLGNKGFAFVDVVPEENKIDDKVNINFVINDAPKYYVNRINIKGNIRTVDKVIRREFKISEGDAYKQHDIEMAEKRIRNLDFFEKVDIDTKTAVDDDNKVDVNVEVKEKSTGNLNFGIGISSVQGAIGKVTFNETNLTGRGQDLTLSMTKTKKDADIELSFTEPYFMDKDLSIGFDIESLHQDKGDLRRFSRVTNGFTFRTSYDVAETLKHTIYYRIRKERIGDLDNSASIMLREQRGSKLVSLIGHSFIWNTVDSVMFPTNGYKVKIGQEFAGLGGNSKYLRHEFISYYYKPIYKEDVVLQLSTNFGHISSIGDSKILVADRFFMGGESLRGFKSYGIGPRDITTTEALGGNILYQGRAQLTYPIGLPKELDARGIFFYDIGSVYGLDYGNYQFFNKDSVNDSKSPRSSVGGGVLWNSPVGGIGLTYAQPIKKKIFDKEKKFMFNIQTQF